MNKLIVPVLAAAVLAGGAAAQAHQRGEQEARAQQARAVKAGPYRSVEASGQLKRGEQLPPRYRTHHYVVENWRTHRLTEPPPGHQWVQAGRDYALVGIATGVVQEVLVGR
jgi:Ni/Co efflux regulator RcnB